MYQTRPDDYAAFRCLAGACPQTCCAAWEIVVDPDVQDAYLRLQHPLAAKLRRVLRVDSEGDTYFAQTDGRCPFLCADGLCELQRTLGEQSLCRTCRDFPRWEVLLCDRVEQGLSPACPEAARRLLERSAPLRFVSAPLPDDGYVPGVRERRLTAAVTAVRDRVLALLVRPGHTAYENLAAAFASPEPLDARWPELLRRAAALPACPPPRMTPVQQTCLAQTIVWRHGMDALDDRDVVFPVRYAAATLRLLDCLAAVSGCTDAQLVVLVTREVENDPEALSRLRAGLQIEPKMNAQEALDHEKM